MQSTSSRGTWTRWMFTDVGDGYFYLTTLNNSNFMRLQVNGSGEVRTVASNFTGSWTHFKFTEVGTSSLSSIAVTTTIDSSEIDNNLAIYPIPAVNYLNISLEEKNDYKNVEIMDMYGNLLTTRELSSNKIDVASLPKGIYFLRLTTTNGANKVVKFIK